MLFLHKFYKILSFYIRFLWGFLHYIPCKKSCRMDPSRMTLSITVFELQGGQEWPRPKFFNFFIFDRILMGFFLNDSL